MPLGDKVRQLDEQVATVVRRAMQDLREEVRKRLDEATDDLRRRLGEVAPELPDSFVNEEDLRLLAEEAAAPSHQALFDAEVRGAHLARVALREAAGALDRATSQAAILEALLAESARFAPRTAILLARDGGIVGWAARGFEAEGDAVRAVSLAAEEEPWRTVARGGPARMLLAGRCAPLVSQLDSPLPSDGVLIPLVLRDRVAALVYGDRTEVGQAIDLDALQLLTYAAGLALETLAFRERPSTVTLRPAEAADAPAPETFEEVEPAPAEPAPEWEAEAGEPAAELEPEAAFEGEEREEEIGLVEEPPAPEEPSVREAGEESWGAGVEVAPATGSFEPVETLEPVEEPEEIETVDEVEMVLEGDEELAPASDLLQPVDEEEAEALERPTAGFESVDERALAESSFAEVSELEQEPAIETPAEPEAPQGEAIPWRTEEPEPFVPEEVEVEGAGEEVTAEAEAVPVEEEAVEAGSDEAVEDVSDRPEAGAVPPPAPRPPSMGPVEPPPDVEGPGWAFSGSRAVVSKGEEAAHEEARRLARLLVSEIQLYNQDEVEEGRRNRDIYERLRDDIDRSRQLYEDRVDAAVRDSTDYFYQELVRQLGAGDAKTLGI